MKYSIPLRLVMLFSETLMNVTAAISSSLRYVSLSVSQLLLTYVRKLSSGKFVASMAMPGSTPG